jgi:hypothetical protein
MKVEFDLEPHLFEALVETSLGRNEDPMNPKFYFGREGVTVNAISTGRTMAFRGEYGKLWFAKYEVEEEGSIMLPSVIRQLIPNLKRAEVLHVSVNEKEININADTRKLSLKLPELEDTKEFPFSEYNSFLALPEKEMGEASIITMGLDNWESMPGKGKVYRVRVEGEVFIEVEDDSGMWKFMKKVSAAKIQEHNREVLVPAKQVNYVMEAMSLFPSKEVVVFISDALFGVSSRDAKSQLYRAGYIFTNMDRGA